MALFDDICLTHKSQKLNPLHPIQPFHQNVSSNLHLTIYRKKITHPGYPSQRVNNHLNNQQTVIATKNVYLTRNFNIFRINIFFDLRKNAIMMDIEHQ